MSALALLLAWAAAAPASAAPASANGVALDGRLVLARYELRGPLEELVLANADPAARRGTTRVVAALRAGEVRTLRVPLESASGTLPPAVLRLVAGGADSEVAVFRGYEEAPPMVLTPALAARTLPPVSRPTARPRPAELAALLAAAALALGLRRRPWWALAAGTAGALGVALLHGLQGVPDAVAVTVLEGDLASGGWVRVDASPGRLRVPGSLLGEPGSAAPLCRVTTRPATARLDWTLDLTAPGLSALSCAVSRGAVHLHQPVARPPRLEPTANGDLPLAATWRRTRGGSWTFHGRWEAGAPLPAPQEAGEGAAGAVPGWLASGLPPGRGILVGRVDGGVDAGDAGPSASGPSWVRASGF